MTTTPAVTLNKIGDCSTARASIRDLFTAPDFYFRTHIPDLLSADEVDALVPAEALLCSQAQHPIGLVWLELLPAGYPSHYFLHARFSHRASGATAAAAVEQAVRTLAAKRPMYRISHEVCEVDDRGLALAEAIGFELEGSVPDLVALGGERYALRYYAKLRREMCYV
jgi:hypothetical protein